MYTESEPLIHLIRTYYRLEKYDSCMNEILKIENRDDQIAIRFIARCSRSLEDNEKAKNDVSQI